METLRLQPDVATASAKAVQEWIFGPGCPDYIERPAGGLANAPAWLWWKGAWCKPGGCRCPISNREIKLYKRWIHRSMLLCLWSLSRADGGKCSWHKISDVFERDPKIRPSMVGDFAKWREHGIIDSMVEVHPDTLMGEEPKKGYYCITRFGYRWMAGWQFSRKGFLQYNSENWGYIGPEVSGVTVVPAEKFNYLEAMNTWVRPADLDLDQADDVPPNALPDDAKEEERTTQSNGAPTQTRQDLPPGSTGDGWDTGIQGSLWG